MGKCDPIEERGISRAPRPQGKLEMRRGVSQCPGRRVRQSMKKLTTREIVHSVDMAFRTVGEPVR